MKKVFNENVVILEEGGRIHFAYMAMSGEFDILKNAERSAYPACDSL